MKQNENEKKNLAKMRHSVSHLMAASVMFLFPKAKLAIGPSIDDGFYYDFELDRPLVSDDLKKIERQMYKLKQQDLKFEHEEWGIKKAINYFKKQNQSYKVELIQDLVKENPKLKKVSIYKTGKFIDLCAGPHISSTKKIGALKLLSFAGAYWRGDEKNKMLQRIYGTAFDNEADLKNHIALLEEAKRRDHRILGQRLGIFELNDEFGAGLPLWLPKGALLRKTIKDFLSDKLLADGYSLVETPHIAKIDLWKTSGHWGFYQDSMYQPFKAEEQEFLVKPMNCPGHIKIYQNSLHSYKEMPIKLSEFGTVYRFERSGTLHGLMRVRGFTQDDAHVFCRVDQLDEEIKKLVKFGIGVLKSFGFSDFDIFLSTKPEKHVGSDENWQKAQDALKRALDGEKLEYQIDPGEGVFYGPKIDIKIKDCLGRSWQCTTIQVDFNLPERFKMFYIDNDGKKTQPIMIHRALLGSLERFIGVLIEHYAGAFPLWLSPVQIRILPISDKHLKFCSDLNKTFKDSGIRSEIDIRSESTGRKIRDAQLEKVPYMIIIGDKEIKANKIAVRNRKGKDLGLLNINKFIKQVLEEIEKRK